MPLLLPDSLVAYRMSQFAIILETHTYQTEAFSNSSNYLSLFSPMNHEGCMWAIRNWVLNRSTVFFLRSTTCRRWQIANWIYEQALLTLLHNYRNAMPLVFKNRAQHFIQICTRFSAWMIEWKALSRFQGDSCSFTFQLYTYFECCRWLVLFGRNKQRRCHVLRNISLFLWALIGPWLKIKSLYGGFDDALLFWETWLDSCVSSNWSWAAMSIGHPADISWSTLFICLPLTIYPFLTVLVCQTYTDLSAEKSAP